MHPQAIPHHVQAQMQAQRQFLAMQQQAAASHRRSLAMNPQGTPRRSVDAASLPNSSVAANSTGSAVPGAPDRGRWPLAPKGFASRNPIAARQEGAS